MISANVIAGKNLADVTTMLKALADSNRLQILDALMQGDSCNCELTDRLGLPPNLLSHHLRILREAGLVTSRRDTIDGRWIYYAVNRAMVADWNNWFANFLNPAKIESRSTLCGPEGQQVILINEIQ